MMTLISSALLALAIILAIPVAVFFIEVAAGIAFPQSDCSFSSSRDPGLRVAVLVPAHNESSGVLPTLADIKAQMSAADRLIVVADNCTDDTAAVAAAASAEVIRRHDADRKGKGYALAAGLSYLRKDPPDVVIVVDADCRLADAAIDRLAVACVRTHRPVQSRYLMSAPTDSPVNSLVAEFAWRVRNLTRPLGLKALGLPCQLMGTGMAFPWDVIDSTNLATGSIVEDLVLGLDLALAGKAPVFCPFPGVSGHFPSSALGVKTQRARWEQGHIGTILTVGPRLFLTAVARADVDLLALTLDLAVPPLSLLAIFVMGMWLTTGFAALFGISSPALVVSTVSLVVFMCGVFLSWLKHGRDVLTLGALLSIPLYAIGKIPIYGRMLSRESGSKWIRTDRQNIKPDVSKPRL
jgi:glycosyltransferase involved in cell wall biosynthesis